IELRQYIVPEVIDVGFGIHRRGTPAPGPHDHVVTSRSRCTRRSYGRVTGSEPFRLSSRPSASRRESRGLKRDDFSSSRHPALAFFLEYDFFQTPVPTFRDHALSLPPALFFCRRGT